VDKETKTILSQVDVGLQAEQFFKTELGKYLTQIAIEEATSAAEDLKVVDPYDTSKIMKLQIKAQVAEAALKWLGEAILIGRQAEHELKIREVEENES